MLALACCVLSCLHANANISIHWYVMAAIVKYKQTKTHKYYKANKYKFNFLGYYRSYTGKKNPQTIYYFTLSIRQEGYF